MIYLRPPLQFLAGLFLALSLTGCGEEANPGPSGDSPQYRSHLEQARFFQSQGQLRASMTEARNAIALRPEAREPYILVAETLLLSGDADRAIKAFTELLTLTPDEATPAELDQARLGLAAACLLKGQLDRASVYLDEITSTASTPLLEKLNLQIRIALARGDDSFADELITQALALEPQHIPTRLLLSKKHYYAGDRGAAMALLDDLLNLAPDESEIWLWKGQILAAEGDYPAAEKAYRRALEEIGQMDVMTLRKYLTIEQFTEVLRAQGKADEASTYQEVLDNSGPGSVRNRYLHALALYRSGLFDEADVALGDILQVAPGHRESGVLAGMVALRKYRWQKAQELLERYVTDQDDIEVKSALHESRLRVMQNQALEDLRATIPAHRITVAERLGFADAVIAPVAQMELQSPAERQNDSLTESVAVAAERSLAPVATEAEILHLGYQHLLRGRPDDTLGILMPVLIGSNPVPANSLPVIPAPDDGVSSIPMPAKLRLLAVAAWLEKSGYEEALALLEDWAEQTPLEAALKDNARGVVLWKGNRSRAREAYLEAILKWPSLQAAHYNLLSLELEEQRWDALLEHLAQPLTRFPDAPFVLDTFLQTALHHHDLTLCLQLLEDVATSSKASGPALILADYHLRTDDPVAAARFLDLSRPLSGAFVGERFVSIDIQVADALAMHAVAQDDTAKARDMANDIARRYPDLIEAQLQAAKIAFAMHNPGLGFQVSADIKQAFPASSLPHEIEGDFYQASKQHGKAVAAYRKAWDLLPSQRLAYKLRNALMSGQKVEAALLALEEWLALQPEDTEAMGELAAGYLAAGKDDEAGRWYLRLIEERPDDATALNHLAVVYQRQKKEEAFALAERAFRLLPESEAVADTYAALLFERGARAQALAVVQEALRSHPTSSALRKRLKQVRLPPY